MDTLEKNIIPWTPVESFSGPARVRYTMDILNRKEDI